MNTVDYRGTIVCEKCKAEVDVHGDAGKDLTFTLLHINKGFHELHIEPMSRKTS